MVHSVIKRAKEIAKIIKDSNEVHIVTHIDADGITAGAIAKQTITRLGKQVSIDFVKQLDNVVIERLKNNNHELVWFTDLGSILEENHSDINKVITDHHSCSNKSDAIYHLNPHLFGLDGSYQISGAGVTYLVSKSINKENIDLSALALVGAIGDLQDRKFCRLEGLNRDILKDAEKIKVVKSKLDINYFGRETRPLFKMIQYASDPIIPGISGRESTSLNFLQSLGIRLKDGDNWRHWIHLCKDERRLIISEITKLLLEKGFGHKIAKRLIGEIYELINESIETELHDAKEFATLLNSTARYGQCEVGLQVCLGNRDVWLKKALSLLQGHRQNLVEGLQFVKEEGIEKRQYLQFFHAKSGIRDTIVGIVTNMLLNSEEITSDLPLVGFANKGESEVKVSARGTQTLIERGLNLSQAMKKSAELINGIGGGHNIAAGATIPKGKEEEFLTLLEKEIKFQLSS
jgi:single-stranded-DNA-specific exonuclease